MDSLDAMARPLRWLEEAARHRATILSSTTLGLQRTTRAVESAGTVADLSAVRIIGVGAEPVAPDVLRGFSRQLRLDLATLRPMYGLAEATVGVAMPRGGGLETLEINGVERGLGRRTAFGHRAPDRGC